MWPFKRKPHTHQVSTWDGYWSLCRCGARQTPGRPWVRHDYTEIGMLR